MYAHRNPGQDTFLGSDPWPSNGLYHSSTASWCTGLLFPLHIAHLPRSQNTYPISDLKERGKNINIVGEGISLLSFCDRTTHTQKHTCLQYGSAIAKHSFSHFLWNMMSHVQLQNIKSIALRTNSKISKYWLSPVRICRKSGSCTPILWPASRKPLYEAGAGDVKRGSENADLKATQKCLCDCNLPRVKVNQWTGAELK